MHLGCGKNEVFLSKHRIPYSNKKSTEVQAKPARYGYVNAGGVCNWFTQFSTEFVVAACALIVGYVGVYSLQSANLSVGGYSGGCWKVATRGANWHLQSVAQNKFCINIFCLFNPRCFVGKVPDVG